MHTQLRYSLDDHQEAAGQLIAKPVIVASEND
jgi:hypothetical protein